MQLEIAWSGRRVDEFDDDGPPLNPGMIWIDGMIRIDGAAAGLTDGLYLLDSEPWSPAAFLNYWDLEGWTCEVYEELSDPNAVGRRFRQPLPRLLEVDSGILYVRLIALKPEFRGMGLGRELLRRWIGDWCDGSVGAVILDAVPLQRRSDGYDAYDDEVRDLPWESPEADAERLTRHFRGWGFHRIGGTGMMVASPRWLGFDRAVAWPPVSIDDDPWDEDDLPF
jgi:GNAT superfamily N-acetyltransferase